MKTFSKLTGATMVQLAVVNALQPFSPLQIIKEGISPDEMYRLYKRSRDVEKGALVKPMPAVVKQVPKPPVQFRSVQYPPAQQKFLLPPQPLVQYRSVQPPVQVPQPSVQYHPSQHKFVPQWQPLVQYVQQGNVRYQPVQPARGLANHGVQPELNQQEKALLDYPVNTRVYHSAMTGENGPGTIVSVTQDGIIWVHYDNGQQRGYTYEDMKKGFPRGATLHRLPNGTSAIKTR